MNPLQQALLTKTAGRISDGVGVVGTGALPYGYLGNVVALMAGSEQPDGTAGKAVSKHKGAIKSLLPGVGAYRQGRVMRAVADESGERGKEQLKHEIVGGGLGKAMGAMAGGAVGAGAGYAGTRSADGTLVGAVVGAGAGMLLPEAAAALLAITNKRRTGKEQHAHEDDNLAANYIPGVGKYNQYKRMGYGYDKYLEKNAALQNILGPASLNLRDLLVFKTNLRKQAFPMPKELEENTPDLGFPDMEINVTGKYTQEGGVAAAIKNFLLKRQGKVKMNDEGIKATTEVSPTGGAYGTAAVAGAAGGAGIGAMVSDDKVTGSLIGGGIGAFALPLALLAAKKGGAFPHERITT